MVSSPPGLKLDIFCPLKPKMKMCLLDIFYFLSNLSLIKGALSHFRGGGVPCEGENINFLQAKISRKNIKFFFRTKTSWKNINFFFSGKNIMENYQFFFLRQNYQGKISSVPVVLLWFLCAAHYPRHSCHLHRRHSSGNRRKLRR